MRRVVLNLLGTVAILLVLGCMGFVLPLELLFYVTFGWILYLIRVVPQVHVNGSGVATAALCLVLLAAGGHAFLSWINREARGNDRTSETAPPPNDQMHGRWRWRYTLGLLGVVVLMFVAGMATVGVAHQVGWLLMTRPLTTGYGYEPSVRARSMNNLKQIGLALQTYSQQRGTFPPAGTFDSIGRPLHGWQAAILPFLEHGKLYDRIDFEVPWADGRNAPVYQTEVTEYLRPGIRFTKDQAGYALSHYAGNAAMLGGDTARTLKDVSDGSANTIMAGEVAAGFKAWGDPTNWRDLGLGINRAANGFGSPSPGGACFLFVDGSVRFVRDNIDLRVLKALGTPAGGEKVGTDEY